ncbi:trihelix transcription factor GTL1-like isoform X2 [Carex rostrata]
MQQPSPPQPPPGGSQYGVSPADMSPFASPTSAPRQMQQIHAEAASPLNSRPPPQSSFEELLPGGVVAGNFPDDIGGDETDRGGASGNRWPRQETLALLKIRSDMDAVFRDATLKGPLWEEVSRKLAELGYRRSAKKCKEKFENVHKYYKRTKENRAGRQDGKTYRFFSQLEALHGSPTTPTQAMVPILPLASVQMPTTQIPVSSPATIGFSAPMAGPSRVVAPVTVTPIEMSSSQPMLRSIQDIGTSGAPPQGISGSTTPTTAAPTTAGISFSSNTESSESDESDDEDTEEIGGTQEQEQGKRKRQGGSGGGSSSKKMMSFFEGLMRQVMERQEAMQQRFLETIEKREQDRMIREEAWRRQEMTRLSREQEILAQERAMAASRDAAVVSFIQRITGQTIPLPTIPAPVITVVPPPPPPSQPAPVSSIPQPQHQPHPPLQHSQSQPSPKTPRQQNPQPLPLQSATPPAVPQQQPQQQQLQLQSTPQPQQKLPQHQQQQCTDIVARQHQPPVTSTEMVLSVPETQESGMGGGFEPGSSSATSSRWPKAEVHALIKIRSGMDSRYQESGPKGPLWEEISAGMRRLGYNRNAKRCKEKWENINKYFKKVKESNKKRPEDSKTCPYFHQLDALYRNKYGSGTAIGAGGGQFDANTNTNSQDSLTFSGPAPPHGPSQPQPISQHPPAGESDSRNSNAGKDNNNSNNDNNRNGHGTDGGNGGSGGTQIPTSNGGTTTTYYSDPSSMGLKKKTS